MQPRSLQPNIFALRTLFTPCLDDFPSSHHPSSVLFQARSCDPTRGVFWIRLDKRVEEHTCAFDVADFGIGFENDTVEGGEVAFGIYGGCGTGSGGGA